MEQREEEAKAVFVRRHYEALGYRVHSGLQFGVDFVLYADSPEAVHSDFCVHIVGDGKFSFFFGSSCEVSQSNGITLLLTISTTPRFTNPCRFLDELLDWREIQTLTRSMPDFHKTLILVNVKGESIEELAMASEHAPFRHRPQQKEVGGQVKKMKAVKETSSNGDHSDSKKPRLGEKEES